jgi:hypothetical protein
MRWGLGPVFAAECVTTSRRWQVYAGRTLHVASVLAAMTLIWLTRFRDGQLTTIQENAAVGLALFDAIMAVELVLAIAIVPAAAAGAICQDKMRGGLTQMMVTDLSDAEIVLGLALATWQPRLGRAVGFSVATFLTVTVVYPTIALVTMRLGPNDTIFLWVSPFFGMLIPMEWYDRSYSDLDTYRCLVMPVWIGLTSAVAYAILQVTIASFDRVVGRMPVARTAGTDDPWPRSVAIGQPRQAYRSPS